MVIKKMDKPHANTGGTEAGGRLEVTSRASEGAPMFVEEESGAQRRRCTEQ